MENLHAPTAYLTFRAEGTDVVGTVPCYINETQARFEFWSSLDDQQKSLCKSVELIERVTVH